MNGFIMALLQQSKMLCCAESHVWLDNITSSQTMRQPFTHTH